MPTVLTVNFTVPTPPPVNGYIVKYREIGTSAYTTVFPNPMNSPVLINVTAGKSYEGSVQSDCGNGYLSSPYTFVVYSSKEIYTKTGFSIQEICGDINSGSYPYYISNIYNDIQPGVTIYKDPNLISPVTGPTFVMNSYGIIYNLLNGVVGANTFETCIDVID